MHTVLSPPILKSLVLFPGRKHCHLSPSRDSLCIYKQICIQFSLFMLMIAYLSPLWFLPPPPLNSISSTLTSEHPFHCYAGSVCQDAPVRCSINCIIGSSTVEKLEVLWSSVLLGIISQMSKDNPLLDISVLRAMPYDSVSCESSCFARQFPFLSTSLIWGRSVANSTSNVTILPEFLLTSWKGWSKLKYLMRHIYIHKPLPSLSVIFQFFAL